MKFVPIRSYDNYVPAHIDMGLLKEEGIDSWLKDEHSVTVNPVLTNAVGGIKLMVAALQAEQADSILTRNQRDRQVCPRCGSKEFLTKEIVSEPSSWLESIVAFFIGKSFLGKENVYYCLECNLEFSRPAIREEEDVNIRD
ncbi:MAG: DUF2007 domain-containing protein [Citrobacter freundii]|nr:MAG: DUF2007 domain-containing protein [Citrobacter freundii]